MVQTKKKTLKKKKKNKSHKVIILLLIIIGIIIFSMITPIFIITQIKIEGNSKIDEETIISLSGLTTGENIFRNSKSKVEANIKQNPYIKEVTMKRILPETVEIKVEERKISYQIKFIDGYIYIDNQGYILEKSTKKAKVPTLNGMTTSQDKLVNSTRLSTEDLNKLNTINKIIDSVKSIEIQDKITTINAENTNEYILYLKNEKKHIYLGDASNLNNKTLYIQMMLQEEKGISGTIFVNGDLNKGFKPYFREKVKNEKKGENNE